MPRATQSPVWAVSFKPAKCKLDGLAAKANRKAWPSSIRQLCRHHGSIACTETQRRFTILVCTRWTTSGSSRPWLCSSRKTCRSSRIVMALVRGLRQARAAKGNHRRKPRKKGERIKHEPIIEGHHFASPFASERRGFPVPHPKSPNTQKNTAFTRTFSKSSSKPFCLFPVTWARNPTEIVQKNLFTWTFLYFGWIFSGVDFPLLNFPSEPPNTEKKSLGRAGTLGSGLAV